MMLLSGGQPRTKHTNTQEEKTMTNAQIIFNQSMKLMEEGKIGTTGRTLTMIGEDGSKTTVNEPEAIHTFAEWKRLGYMVQKGQKAIAKFSIWNFSSKKHNLTADEASKMNQAIVAGRKYEEGEEITTDSHYYMHTAAFFTMSQTTAAEKMLPAVI
jgi:hypothetical protein